METKTKVMTAPSCSLAARGSERPPQTDLPRHHTPWCSWMSFFLSLVHDSSCARPGRRRTSPVAVPVCRAINRPPAGAHTGPGWVKTGSPSSTVLAGATATSSSVVLFLFMSAKRHNQG